MSKEDNQNPNTIQFTTKEEQEQFDRWTKEQIYEAYLLEVKARKRREAEVIRVNRILAEVRYLVK